MELKLNQNKNRKRKQKNKREKQNGVQRRYAMNGVPKVKQTFNVYNAET